MWLITVSVCRSYIPQSSWHRTRSVWFVCQIMPTIGVLSNLPFPCNHSNYKLTHVCTTDDCRHCSAKTWSIGTNSLDTLVYFIIYSIMYIISLRPLFVISFRKMRLWEYTFIGGTTQFHSVVIYQAFLWRYFIIGYNFIAVNITDIISAIFMRQWRRQSMRYTVYI